MKSKDVVPRSAKILRWIARIWSLPVFALALLQISAPDPNITQPVPAEDMILLSLWGVAILGLLVAWRWELVGGLITIATMFMRELVWVMLKGGWLVNFLIAWLLIVPPAVLFLIAWRLERKGE
ncbi:MAG: hypothetical protein JXB15_14195 [Anaerolineales bacterium]|nr:hypothetical protein [Anaerolineales bacterium]